MFEITNPRLLWLKGGLFLSGGVLAATLIVLDNPAVKTLVLLCVAVWCFCRAYYFAFYVIERYVDPSHRFAGLLAFVRYAVSKGCDTRHVG